MYHPMNVARLAAFGTVLLGLCHGAFAKPDFDGAMKFVPSSFTTVAAVDLGALSRTPLYATAKGLIGMDGDMSSFEGATGITIDSDVLGVVFAGPDALVTDEDRFVAVVEIKGLKANKLTDFVMAGAGDYADKKHATGAYLSSKEGAMAIRGNFVLFSPSGKDLTAALDASKSGKGAAKGPLAGQLASVKGHTIYGAIGGSKHLQKWLAKQGQGASASGISAAAAGVTLNGTGMTVSASGEYATAKAATALVERIKGLLKEYGTDPDLTALGLAGAINKLTPSAKGKAATITLSLTKAEMETIVEIVAGMFEDDEDWD